MLVAWCENKFRSFRLNFSSNINPFAIYGIGRLSCGTSLIHSPYANVDDPNYFSNRFPCAENALAP